VRRPRRYVQKRYVTSGSICCSCNHCPRVSTNSANTAVWPPSLHLVMCFVNSPKTPQLGHLFCTFFRVSIAGYRDSIQLVPLKWDTCFVIHTLNILGKDFMTFCIHSQYTKFRWCNRSCATCSPQRCVISSFGKPVILVPSIIRPTPLEGNKLRINGQPP
jgi:hypothetical protein